MRVGVIGAGVMGNHHARIYRELGADLVGIADMDIKKAQEAAGKYNTRAYKKVSQLLEQGLDAVSVAVPSKLHAKIAAEVADYKVNMLVEKPISDTMEGGRRIIDAAGRANVVLMVGHIERFNPAVQKLVQIIGEGVLGDLVVLSSRRVGPFVPRVKDIGITMDVASHDIDIARYLTNSEPIKVLAKSINVKNKKGDCAIMILDFGRVTASIEVNWFTPHKVRSLVVTGTEGIAYADYIEQSVTIFNSSWKMEPKIEKSEPLSMELRHFLECVERKKEPLISGEDGLRTLEIALKIERSSFNQ